MDHLGANAGLLTIVGSDDPGGVKRAGNLITLIGSTDLTRFVFKGEYHRLHLTPSIVKERRVPVLDGYHHILNTITEPATNKVVLGLMKKILRGAKATVINAPENVLKSTRDQVSRRLAGIDNLVVPRVHLFRSADGQKAARAIAQAGLDYPLIIRRPGTHTGRSIVFCATPEDVERDLDQQGDYVAIEFNDFRSGDGIYRKYRVYFIGEQRVFRHQLASDHWNVHAHDRDRFLADHPRLIEEEEARFERPEGVFSDKVNLALEEIRERMGLDFFGVDFALLDDETVLLFEANATMSFFGDFFDRRFPYMGKAVKPAGDAFRKLVGLPPIDIAPETPFERAPA